mgnify:CR=1 FL=1
MRKFRNPAIKLFLSKAVKLGSVDGPCIIWPFATSKGYGVISNKPASDIQVHELMCTIEHGEKPSDKHEVAHSCNNRRCIRRSHLRWATRSENFRDKYTSLTSGFKLTSDDVNNIRNSRLSNVELASKYNVSSSHLSSIRTGHSRHD